MEKNQIWAIVLSTIILGAYFFFIAPRFQQKPQNAQSDVAIEQNEQVDESVAPVEISSSEDESAVEEQNFIIETNKIRATLSNKGGDIIGFELLDHIDKDTGKGVELADNISANNRSCSLSFGGAESPTINEIFSVEQVDSKTILFTKHFNGFTLGKRYSFVDDEYMFKLDILLHSDDGKISLNQNDVAYTIRTSPQIGPHFNQKKNRYDVRQFLTFNGSKKKSLVVGSKQFKSYDKNYTWAGIVGKYFETLIVPENPSIMSTEVFYSSLVEVDDYANAQAFLPRKNFYGSDLTDTYYLYYGPRNEKDLKKYNSAQNNGWGLENKKLTESLQGYDWLGWLEIILKWILERLYSIVHNWGVAIILMTVLLKLAMFPLTRKQSLGTLKMQKLQPQMQAIQDKYKDNPQKMQMELSKLYKENNYNPMSGCLPLLLQFLIIFAMFDMFNNYFEFRGASFIPGWIPDLSTGDSIYTFQKDIPIVTAFFGNAIRILPVIYLITQLLHGKITMSGGTAAASSSAFQMKFMSYGMPIMFFFLFYSAPAGLLLYWTVSNIIQIAQQIFINKIMTKKEV
ncbi:MAG: membrane protein insertase YidC [Treponema sp.]|nr:membrane protein insertase YidC [Treponema sp.]